MITNWIYNIILYVIIWEQMFIPFLYYKDKLKDYIRENNIYISESELKDILQKIIMLLLLIIFCN